MATAQSSPHLYGTYRCRTRPCPHTRHWVRVLLQRQVSLLYPSPKYSDPPFPSEIRVWTLGGDHVYSLSGHTSFVYSLSVLPNGDIVSSGEDRTVRVWKGKRITTILTTGQCTDQYQTANARRLLYIQPYQCGQYRHCPTVTSLADAVTE